MADKYLDDSGLSYFWGKLKAYFQAKLSTTSPSHSITTSVGSRVGSSCRRYGNVVTLQIQVQKSSATNAGANVYEGNLGTTALRPLQYITTGTFYGQYSLIGSINSAGNIILRNATDRSFPAVTGTNNISFTFTYVVA